VRTIDFLEQGDGAITLIDQRLLPHEKKILTVKTHQELIEAIQTLAVRGAPALGVAGALGVALIALRSQQENWSQEERDSAIAALRAARPTAVNLAWGVDQVLPELVNGPSSVLSSALAISRADGLANRAMGKLGAAYLLEKCGKKKLRILTHCNTGSLATSDWGTALGVIRELSQQGYIEEVFADETRPLLQGSRLTAGINYRILPDGAAASALFSGLIDAVLIGADRIARNGDSANKIGSLGVAVAAKERGIPFLVVAPESTIDRSLASGDEIEIEFRADSEVTHFAGIAVAPLGAKSYNPAFDVTLARYITAIVTEKCVYQISKGEAL
jgi:methylthioribose-1-phosphate isomerase